tara:strand:+ start:32790 stop:32951 length:162 start_codon:yes stop_codon:yes gene_type:complete
LRSLTRERLVGSKQHGLRLLFRAFDRNEPHIWLAGSVRGIFLPAGVAPTSVTG